MKRVYKYGTGHDVPEGAQYLCTKVEATVIHDENVHGMPVDVTHNVLVWHYFLVEVDE